MGQANCSFAAGSDEADIRSLSANWGKAYNKGDPKAVADLYAEDALVLAPGFKELRGRTAILHFYINGIADAKAVGMIYNPNPKSEIMISGNMAWESGTYTETIKGEVVEVGKYLSVYQKKNGKWEYIRDTWNSDLPSTPIKVATEKK